jgi:hypothetical protein
MSDQDEAKVYEDLIGFLKSDRSDLRLAATDAVLAVKDRYVSCQLSAWNDNAWTRFWSNRLVLSHK